MTRTSKKLKTVISLLAVVIVLSSIAIVPANAVYSPFIQRSKAFIASALAAINIVAESATMDAASVIEYIADPMEVQYTYVDAWQDRPEIQIYPDFTVIDGVPYTDIWISNEAAEKFRVDAFDFQTAYNIASQSNGTFKSGVGTMDGALAFREPSGTIVTQGRQINFPVGRYGISDNGYVENTQGASARFVDSRYYGPYQYNTNLGTNLQELNFPFYIRYGRVGNTNRIQLSQNGINYGDVSTGMNLNYVYEPFDFDYVAGNIPADTPLPEDTGMMIRVPSNNPITGDPYFDDWLVDNPEFNQGQPVTIDVNLDPSIENKLSDLLDILIPIMPIINNNQGDVQFIENHTQPQPQPDTLLPDTYWSQVENKLDQIRQTIQNLTPDFSQIIQTIQNIPQSFSQITQPITQAINNLGDKILQDIEEGPIKLLDKLIDVLRNIFFPILATLRSFLSIWHYVVTWMGNISAPFTWIMGLMAGASPILVSPIYALIAGIIVIAVYRRFGK